MNAKRNKKHLPQNERMGYCNRNDRLNLIIEAVIIIYG